MSSCKHGTFKYCWFHQEVLHKRLHIFTFPIAMATSDQSFSGLAQEWTMRSSWAHRAVLMTSHEMAEMLFSAASKHVWKWSLTLEPIHWTMAVFTCRFTCWKPTDVRMASFTLSLSFGFHASAVAESTWERDSVTCSMPASPRAICWINEILASLGIVKVTGTWTGPRVNAWVVLVSDSLTILRNRSDGCIMVHQPLLC